MRYCWMSAGHSLCAKASSVWFCGSTAAWKANMNSSSPSSLKPGGAATSFANTATCSALAGDVHHDAVDDARVEELREEPRSRAVLRREVRGLAQRSAAGRGWRPGRARAARRRAGGAGGSVGSAGPAGAARGPSGGPWRGGLNKQPWNHGL